MGRPFTIFLVIVSIFTLGNSSDAFLVLRAQNLGITVTGILVMLVMFNLIYTLISTPAGSLSDRIGRRRLIIGGWLVYAVIYLGFALAQSAWQVWALYVVYGLYYGMAYGTANALVADLVPEQLRGTAYGTYNAIIGILAFPASLDCRVALAGLGFLAGLWAISTIPFWGIAGINRGILDGSLDAKTSQGINTLLKPGFGKLSMGTLGLPQQCSLRLLAEELKTSMELELTREKWFFRIFRAVQLFYQLQDQETVRKEIF